MRVVLTTLAFLALSAMPQADGLSDGDRERLLAHLEMTESWLVNELEGLSPEQQAFRMTETSWHITDVVEHLAIAEPQYWQHAMASMKEPPSKEKPEASDAGILWYGIDRTRRDRTGEARVPKGRYKSAAEALADFRRLRAEIVKYVRTTNEDPRSRRLINGNMDVYQWILMISTHSQRHILQIREIKAHKDYPRSRTGS